MFQAPVLFLYFLFLVSILNVQADKMICPCAIFVTAVLFLAKTNSNIFTVETTFDLQMANSLKFLHDSVVTEVFRDSSGLVMMHRFIKLFSFVTSNL